MRLSGSGDRGYSSSSGSIPAAMEDHDIYTPGEEEHEMVREDEEGSASSSTGMKKHSGCGQSESVGTRSSGFTPPDSLGRSTTTPWMTSVTTSPTGSIEICGMGTWLRHA
ncbi:uncharacterized protein [Aegilops tauschii subsp. strangulata]|uniref:uncharacterized protein n=1 Tax=Aegilops tauschii subsp. strangulata TaxID=200361 RepID=UPI003CC8C00C